MVAVAGMVLLDMVSRESAEWLSAAGQRQSYRQGELIHNRGDAKATMGIVMTGIVQLGRLRQDGSMTFVSLMHPGQHFGDVLLLAGRPRTHDAIAIEPTEIDYYDMATFNQMLLRSDILRALYTCTAARLTGAMAMSDDLRGLTRDQHLAKILLHQWNLFGKPDWVPCVQEDLATLLGVTLVTLSKCLARLRQQGLLETGYRQIRITDPARLRQWLRAQVPD